MAYQETRTTGYGTRLGNSFKGITSGIMMIIAGTCLLWWNEGRAVKTAKMLEEAAGAAVHIEDVQRVDPGLDGQLIHATALAATNDSLIDPTFNIGITGIQLIRDVEYYQWVEESTTETKDKIGGSQVETTTYTYKKEWTSHPVNSAEFKDPEYQNVNTAPVQFEKKNWMAQHVTFGGYKFTESMIQSISGKEPLNLNIPEAKLKEWDMDMAKTLGEKVATKVVQKIQEVVQDSTTTASEPETTSPSITGNDNYNYVHVSGNTIYFGKSTNNPQVGDVRVTFTCILPHNVSIIAQVAGDTFQRYTAKNGKSLLMVENGVKGMDQMFQGAESSNQMWTWILRIIGILVVCGGLKGIFNFLVILLKVLPFLASIMNFGVNLVCNIIGIAWSLIIIALAWLFYRPLLSICLLAVVGGLIFFFVKKGREKKQAEV